MLFLVLGLLLNLISVVSSSDSYTPGPLVVAGHGIPHLTQTLKETDNKFYFKGEDGKISQEVAQDYVISAAVLPAIFLVLGVLSVVIYQLIICCRPCCKCCRAPERFDRSGKKSYCERVFFMSPKVMWSFVLFIIMVLVANSCVFIGSDRLSTGFNQASDSVLLLAGTFTNVKEFGSDLQDLSDSMETTINSGSCSDVPSSVRNSITSSTTSLSKSAGQFSDQVGSIPKTLTDFSDQILSSIQQKDLVVYIYFAVITIVAFFFICTHLCRSKCSLTLVIMLTEMIILTLTLIACVEMVLVTLLSDFCIDPVESILNLLPSGTAQDSMDYYLTCSGESIFNSTLVKVAASVRDISDQIDSSYDSACVTSLNAEINTASDLILDLNNILGCTYIKPVFDKAILQALCGSGFDGIFTVWLTHFLTAGSLYFVLMSSSFFYQLFKPVVIHADGYVDGEMAGIEIVAIEHEYQNVDHHDHSATTGTVAHTKSPMGEPEYEPVQGYAPVAASLSEHELNYLEKSRKADEHLFGAGGGASARHTSDVHLDQDHRSHKSEHGHQSHRKHHGPDDDEYPPHVHHGHGADHGHGHGHGHDDGHHHVPEERL